MRVKVLHNRELIGITFFIKAIHFLKYFEATLRLANLSIDF